MSAAHTPGGWAVNDVRYNRDYRTCMNVMTADGLRFVAAVSCDPCTDTRQLRANARLIAAAPALLEALEAIDASWTESFPKGPDGNYGAVSIADEHKAFWQKARAAISLAKGESA